MRWFTWMLKYLAVLDPWKLLPSAGVTCVGSQAPASLFGKLIATTMVLFAFESRLNLWVYTSMRAVFPEETMVIIEGAFRGQLLNTT